MLQSKEKQAPAASNYHLIETESPFIDAPNGLIE